MFEQSLQYQIANKMKQVHDSLQNYPTKDVAFMLFKNLQVDKNKTTGFKLTKLGFQLLKKESITSHVFWALRSHENSFTRS